MSNPYEGDSTVAATPGIKGTNTAGGSGVDGESTSGVGVSGSTQSANQSAIFGFNGATGPVPGGLTHPAGGGVWGHTKVSGGTGVIGSTEPNVTATGVLGIGNGTGAGVNGTSANGVGVSGETNSASQSAIFGFNGATGPVPGGLTHPAGGGVWGHTKVEKGSGVIGSVEPGLTQAAGVTGIGPIAGHFFGNVVVTGDVQLTGAGCAEQFDIAHAESVEPGTVMALGEGGILEPSQFAYDKRVAGVVSGAGNYKPGIVLDKQESHPNRKPIALVGKVYCKADAEYSPIEIGDLLTTSATPGHAMKAVDRSLAFGAVLGKALRPLTSGRGLIPILIALQ